MNDNVEIELNEETLVDDSGYIDIKNTYTENSVELGASYRRWTRSAVDCYNRGCRCDGCIYLQILSSPCRMKRTVIGLVRKFGKPPKVEEITKEMFYDLVCVKKMKRTEIYKKLNIEKDEYEELLIRYEIYKDKYR